MAKINKTSFQSMVSTYYIECDIEFDNGVRTVFMVEVNQIGSENIAPDAIDVLGVVAEDAPKIEELPENYFQIVVDKIMEKISVEWTLMMRIQQTKEAMKHLGLIDTDKQKEKQNTQSQFGKDNPPVEYYKELIATHENYEAITNPLEFIKNFKDLNEFRGWCMEGNVKDLEAALKEFEKVELFECCAIIQDCIKHKKHTDESTIK